MGMTSRARRPSAGAMPGRCSFCLAAKRTGPHCSQYPTSTSPCVIRPRAGSRGLYFFAPRVSGNDKVPVARAGCRIADAASGERRGSWFGPLHGLRSIGEDLPGAQTERRGLSRAVGALLGGNTSPAVDISCLSSLLAPLPLQTRSARPNARALHKNFFLTPQPMTHQGHPSRIFFRPVPPTTEFRWTRGNFLAAAFFRVHNRPRLASVNLGVPSLRHSGPTDVPGAPAAPTSAGGSTGSGVRSRGRRSARNPRTAAVWLLSNRAAGNNDG
jgi:hypothetical protein